MKSIVFGLALMTCIGVVAAFALAEAQRRAYVVYSTSGARVGDPGENLVGPDWSEPGDGVAGG
ncbi:hypothetical protein Sa4125_16870 [Aureimonas sp. SA4125]|uniref:hypothetical protein n=1 Tax=Aureimonas sp. SA4125 TaxID=2826993 RepID=UPI001CC34BA4|nr:hypothetical protein [Aureimonas sp. SA4125]BDA84145.1 hypothetical protein Sa4125_16870 [Aureimonas sp. SA4125]